MQKYIYLTLIFFSATVLSACSTPPTKLEGVWQSNRELTISHFGNYSNLTKSREKFLREHLGELHFSFRGNQTKTFTSATPEAEAKSQKFRIIRETDEFFLLELYISYFNKLLLKYYKAGDCIILKSKHFGYDEYFCRKI